MAANPRAEKGFARASKRRAEANAANAHVIFELLPISHRLSKHDRILSPISP
jgi:hypothetical protein